MFEYGDLLATYFPSTNIYEISSMTYCMRIGTVSLLEGPGWVVNICADFFGFV